MYKYLKNVNMSLNVFAIVQKGSESVGNLNVAFAKTNSLEWKITRQTLCEKIFSKYSNLQAHISKPCPRSRCSLVFPLTELAWASSQMFENESLSEVSLGARTMGL